MTKREHGLASMRIAGYHNDGRARVRLLVETRINRPIMDAAWTAGQSAKAAGVACGCFECKAK